MPALAQQRIHPYTDLLLDDLGEGLADHRADFEGSGSEFHDGRAAGIDEAIRWHGGEGERARRAYEALPPDERAALVRFVGSI